MSTELSVQLYTVRDALAADSAATLRRLADIGFTRVEPFGFSPDQLDSVRALADVGLSAPSVHANYLADGVDQAALFAAAAEAGITTVIEPFTTAEHTSTADAAAHLADRLNAAGEIAASFGLKSGYHNHQWELEARIGETSALEYLAGLLDDSLTLEIDTYWAQVGGENPAALLTRLGDRVSLIHVKDGDASTDTLRQLPAGEGVIDIPAILAAAPQAIRVVEFDAYAGDIFDGLAASYRYLTELEASA